MREIKYKPVPVAHFVFDAHGVSCTSKSWSHWILREAMSGRLRLSSPRFLVQIYSIDEAFRERAIWVPRLKGCPSGTLRGLLRADSKRAAPNPSSCQRTTSPRNWDIGHKVTRATNDSAVTRHDVVWVGNLCTSTLKVK